MNELDRRASDAGHQVSSTATHLRKIAEELRGDDLSRPAAQLADRGAQTLEEIGRYLEQSKGDRLLADAERFGRRRPWILATAGVALGLAGSRMLKASAARRAGIGDYDGATSDGAATGSPYYAEQSAPVSSDAAPVAAAEHGSWPSPAPYQSAGASFAGETSGFGSVDEHPVSKSSEAQRLTNSDGS